MQKILLSGFLVVMTTFLGFSQDPAKATDTLSSVPLNADFIQSGPEVEHVPADTPADLIADRMTCIESEFPLTLNVHVRGQIDRFTLKSRGFVKTVLRRKDLYFPIFEKYLAQYNLPDELKYLSIIESGLSPVAVSRAKAVGLWQFMPGTGKLYGLHTNWYWDDRMDPERSTEAACKFLSELYKMFKDWPLALAAYNSGPGTVMKANRRSGYKNNFWDIYQYLPNETRAYVPQFMAMVYVMKYADEHNFYEPNPEQPLPSDTLHISTFLNVDVFNNLTGTCSDDFRKLNPQLTAQYIPDNDRTHIIRVPLDTKATLTANRMFVFDSATRSGTKDMEKVARKMEEQQYLYHKVKSGNTLGSIASKYGVRTTDIRTWNKLRSNTIHPGQMLKIYTRGGAQAIASNNTKKQPAKSPQTGKSTKGIYVVQSGDTLWSIAQQKGTTIQELRKLNKLSSNRITPGQKLVLR